MSQRKKLLSLFNIKPFDIEAFRQALTLNDALGFPVKEKEIIAVLEMQEYDDISQFFRWDRIAKIEKAWQKFCSKWGDNSPLLNWSPVWQDDTDEPRLSTMWIEVPHKYDIKDVKKDVNAFASKEKGLKAVRTILESKDKDHIALLVEFHVDVKYFLNLEP